MLRLPTIANLLDEFPRSELLAAVRAVLDACRQELLAGRGEPPAAPTLALSVRARLQERRQPRLKRVINATGIVLHTGLGRAPLAEEAIEAITQVAGGYCNLELDLASGERGDRHTLVREMLCELTGAEDALVVNNNAAATFLALHTLAGGGEAIVSRGQLVEIGGSYRLPDIMAAAGCTLVEVGTTNRTRLADYAGRLGERTRVLLRVHTSNYRIVGFTQATRLDELVRLAASQPEPRPAVVDDLGSGLLDQPQPPALVGAPAPAAGAGAQHSADESHVAAPMPPLDEPSVRDSIAAGADVVLFSGDKLLGGPQAGVIVGRHELLMRLQRSPLMRTFRPDKLTLAALEATLRLYRDPPALAQRLPVWRMLSRSAAKLHAAGERVRAQLAALAPDAQVSVAPDESYAGGGALPALALPTVVVEVRGEPAAAEDLCRALRERDLPVVGRVHRGALLLDMRTVAEDEEEPLATAVAEALAACEQVR